MLSQADEATIIIPSSPIFREKQEQLAQGKNYSLLVKIFGSSKKMYILSGAECNPHAK